MQILNIHLFEEAYALKPKAEQRAMFLALASVALHLGLLVYLATASGFAPGFLLIYLLNLPLFLYFMYNVWLSSRPHYRRHLTLTEQGVRYRPGFMRREHEFDWEEVDAARLERCRVVFILKNEEQHEVSLEKIENEEVLQQVKQQIRNLVRRKEIALAEACC